MIIELDFAVDDAKLSEALLRALSAIETALDEERNELSATLRFPETTFEDESVALPVVESSSDMTADSETTELLDQLRSSEATLELESDAETD
jgi:uncharacterized membrane protein